MALPPPAFRPATLAFFTELAAEQNRDWFLAHKADYEAHVKTPLGALVDDLALAFAAHDIPLTGTAKTSLFRPQRDTRFAKDKRPYKTNAGAVLSRDGTKTGKGILYIQIGGPKGSFLALGFHQPEPADLAILRRAVVDHAEHWLTTVSALDRAGLALSRDSAMARMPRGFEAAAETPVAGDVRLRSFVVTRPIVAERLFSPDLIGDVLTFARAGQPLLAFGWTALGLT